MARAKCGRAPRQPDRAEGGIIIMPLSNLLRLAQYSDGRRDVLDADSVVRSKACGLRPAPRALALDHEVDESTANRRARIIAILLAALTLGISRAQRNRPTREAVHSQRGRRSQLGGLRLRAPNTACSAVVERFSLDHLRETVVGLSGRLRLDSW